MADAAVQARPQMADVGIDNGIEMTDAAVSAHPEFEFDTSTSTSSDQRDSKYQLIWILLNNKSLLESAGLQKALEPVLKGNGHKLSPLVDNDSYIWIDGSSVSVFGKDSNRAKAAITKKVDWLSTFKAFMKLVKDRGDMDKTLTNADNHAKEILTNYYKKLQEDDVKIPFRLNPIVHTKDGVKPHPSYYFGQPAVLKTFSIFRNGQDKPISGDGLKYLMKTINWMDTFTTLLDGFKEVDKYLHEETDPKLRKNLDDNLKIMNEAQKKYEAAKQRVKSSNSKAARSALKAASSAVKATKAVFDIKSKRYNDASVAGVDAFNDRQTDRSVKQTMNSMLNQVSGSGLKGRGLRGAGVAPLEGIVRRGRTYNLKIQGLATPSTYVYRQLGSKYIRIPDLDNKTLVIVQPNRRKCGPKRGISGPLQLMIRTLAFKQFIDQEEYDKLTIDDKKLFKEILAITHLQYNFHD
ncbi:unnamed protein product [Phytophthora lilii]|uniref:Unnamed protein product n=1 Tax=Phytophthora lilii TaxID=2077276 RepID=A0A9W6THL7_9STRA|nr:unnamed protein product [Phytophthora lilii]